jgi:AraC-like DNA-binding protein
LTEIFDNIRQLYRFKKPAPELEEYIEFFSESDPAATEKLIGDRPFSIKLFPSYTPTVWINLGTNYTLKSAGQTDWVDKDKPILVLRSNTLERVNSPQDHIFTIKFKPCGFEAIFGIPQSRLGQQLHDASALFGIDIHQKIVELGEFERRMAYFETLFLERLHKTKKEQFIMEKINVAIEQYLFSGMELKTAALAQQTYLTEKSLYRYFVNNVGTNPRNYLNNVRIRASLEKYLYDRPNFSVHDFGFYDLSHFYRSYEHFTGQKFAELKG